MIMKKQLLLFLISLLPLVISADAVEINGIDYALNPSDKTAELKSYLKDGSGTIELPESFIYDGIYYNLTSIGTRAFNGCGSITSVRIPNSVTTIKEYAFEGCSSLKEIVIGSGIEDIHDYAFSNCKKISDVYIYAIRYPIMNATTFQNSYPDYITLHVPEESLQQYSQVSPWNAFMKIMGIPSGFLCFTVKGKPVVIALSSRPVINYTNNYLHIITDENTIDIPVEDISYSEFQQTTAINHNDYNNVRYSSGKMVFQDLPTGSVVTVCSLDGKLQNSITVGDNHMAEIDIRRLPAGAYIIKTAIQTIKITNK